jgi:hypothetical protein
MEKFPTNCLFWSFFGPPQVVQHTQVIYLATTQNFSPFAITYVITLRVSFMRSLPWLHMQQVVQRLHVNFPWPSAWFTQQNLRLVSPSCALLSHIKPLKFSFVIKSMTSSVMNPATSFTITHSVQVLHFTTTMLSMYTRSVPNSTFPSHHQPKLYRKFDANFVMNKFAASNRSSSLRTFPLNFLRNKLP